jgi:DHA1 family multidrug resistance protein-like MFS transporter
LRTPAVIGIAVGVGSMSFNFWYPFMPLYLLQIGARSEANALFWIAIATSVQGITRLLTGPFWGVLSDRMGRKLMLMRALVLATPTTLIAAVIGAPWQISIALAFQGFFSGFVPASVALATVSVPESRVSASLSVVTGAQYLGTTAGPAVGAILATFLGFRGTILFAAILPSVAALLVFLFVPNDQPQGAGGGISRMREPLEPFRPSLQLWLVLFFYFVVFSLTQLLRIATPIALKHIQESNVKGITGLAFTLGGLASAVAVLAVGPAFFREGRRRLSLVAACLFCALAFLLLSRATTIPMYVLFFVLASLTLAAMVPATNSLIAANAPRSRRGTAFGWAGSAQALAFVAGPMGAALFAAISLDLGFVVLFGILCAIAVLLFFALREPRASDSG